MRLAARAARFLLSTALAMCASSSAVAGSSHCPDKSSRPASSFVNEFDGICYEFHLELLTWKEANASCARRGGALATVDRGDRQEFLARVLQPDPALRLVWIGAKITQARGTWIWAQTGQPLTYTNWATYHPKNDFLACGSMGRDDGWRWQSVYCESNMFTHSYICQYDGRAGGGLLSDSGKVIGLAVGLGAAAFCVVIAVIGIVVWIRRRRRAQQRRSFSSYSTEQKISNIGGSCKYDLNALGMLNIGPAPPAYGQVTTIDGGEMPSSAEQPLLCDEQLLRQQQMERCNNDLLASNLASHSSQAAKLQDKCLLELMAANSTSPAAAEASAAEASAAAGASPYVPPDVGAAVGQGDGSQAAIVVPVTPARHQPALAAESAAADGGAEEADALLQSNDLS